MRESQVTRQKSNVTRHTSHVTRQKSHVKSHTSHVTRHTSHVTRHTSPWRGEDLTPVGLLLADTSCSRAFTCRWGGVANAAQETRFTFHTSHVTRHTSHVTRHTSHVTRHTSHVTRHTSHVTRHTSHITHQQVVQVDGRHGAVVVEPGGAMPAQNVTIFDCVKAQQLAPALLHHVIRGLWSARNLCDV